MSKYTLSSIHFEQSFKLSLDEITESLGVSQQTIVEIVDEGIVSPLIVNKNEFEFDAPSLRKIRTVLQLKHDLGINIAGAALAIELLDDRIRVNCVAPGTIEVESYFDKDPLYTRDKGNSLVPWGRVGLPFEVGSLVSFLVSDESEFMTGQTLYFDGGLTSKMAISL